MASEQAESSSRAARFLKHLLQGGWWKLSQCPVTTHGHCSESQTTQLLLIHWGAMATFFSLLMGEGLSPMGHPPEGHLSGLYHIQNVSYRHFIFQKARICKSPPERELEDGGASHQFQHWAQLSSDKIYPSYTFINIWFPTDSSLKEEFGGQLLNVTTISLQ